MIWWCWKRSLVYEFLLSYIYILVIRYWRFSGGVLVFYVILIKNYIIHLYLSKAWRFYFLFTRWWYISCTTAIVVVFINYVFLWNLLNYRLLLLSGRKAPLRSWRTILRIFNPILHRLYLKICYFQAKMLTFRYILARIR